MKSIIKVVSLIAFIGCSVILMLISVGYSRIPNEISIKDYDELTSGGTYMCQPIDISANATVMGTESYETSVRLFNIFPIKSAKINVSERKYVVLGGDVFGIRLYTKGVMVIKTDYVLTQSGKISPANEAGLKVGDMILSADGKNIDSNKTLSKIISSSQGNAIKLKVSRNSKEIELTFYPVKSNEDSKYKGGLWIRDSTAGIGTMTYYDRNSGVFAGLGHAVCDVDTGEIMPLSGGDAVKATVKGCYKGTGGNPGELCGVFSGSSLGQLYLNGNTGIYGVLSVYDKNAQIVPVALPSEISVGKAEIVSTVNENEKRNYSIEITKINQGTSDVHNLIIKIIDPELIKTTGGIVQGMSGSPIIQNGKLVGAVTHVFVDNALEGYGIFAQNMIETQISLEETLKKDIAG